MTKLWAVDGDPNTHGGGELIVSGASSPDTVKINGKSIIVHKSPAQPDNLGHPLPQTATAAGSGTVFCYGSPVHRQDDPRDCGATTIVLGQSTVFIGG